MARRGFDPEKAAAILKILADGTPPFFAIAGQRVGVSSGRLDGWMRRGAAEADEGGDSPQALFALEALRIQAEWKARTLEQLNKKAPSKEEAAAHNSLRWTLTCMDRLQFDTSRLPKNAPKGESEMPPQKRKSASEVTASLSTPEEDLPQLDS